ncbi:MAG: hypothetical protein JW395_1286 [Nitrospira sp.]|nr:hypothetical protein [Nitrospira sp.]
MAPDLKTSATDPSATDVSIDSPDTQIKIEITGDQAVGTVVEPPEEKKETEAGTASASDPDSEDADEAKEYSEKVQKRIRKLRWEKGEEQRAKKNAVALQEEAVRYASTVAQENARLRATLEQGEKALIETVKSRIATDLENAKIAARSAHLEGDTDKIIAAQEAMAQVIAERERVGAYRPVHRQPVQEFKPEQAPAPAPARDERAEDWAAKNAWFGKDEEMTGLAYGTHEKLVRSGLNPITDADAYYSAIDKSMRKYFPDKFERESQSAERSSAPSRTSVVAPVVRTSGKQRIVTLTENQVALARRLGLTKEQYASQIAKEFSNG